MSTFSATDCAHMAHALKLAWRGRYAAHPNPRVGCVVVSEGAVVGTGWHEMAGAAHAEINALAAAKAYAAGATVYVTLEPCAHHGKTAPCSDALIRAGVASVVAAMADPFPDVSGEGIRALERAGIDVRVGLMEREARRLNEGYLSRIERGRPFVRLKIAASLDGGTAMSSGESRWITGAEARRDVQRQRAASGAVLTGVGTVLGDDPALTVRQPDLCPRQPLRVIVDSRLRTPAAAATIAKDGQTHIYCIDDAARGALERAGAQVHKVAAEGERVALDKVLEDLARRGVNDVLAECGATLAGRLLAADLVDELVIYQSPHIMGSEVRSMFETPDWESLSDRRSLAVVDVRRVGADTRITARPGTKAEAG